MIVKRVGKRKRVEEPDDAPVETGSPSQAPRMAPPASPFDPSVTASSGPKADQPVPVPTASSADTAVAPTIAASDADLLAATHYGPAALPHTAAPTTPGGPSAPNDAARSADPHPMAATAVSVSDPTVEPAESARLSAERAACTD